MSKLWHELLVQLDTSVQKELKMKKNSLALQEHDPIELIFLVVQNVDLVLEENIVQKEQVIQQQMYVLKAVIVHWIPQKVVSLSVKLEHIVHQQDFMININVQVVLKINIVINQIQLQLLIVLQELILN